MSLNYKLYAIYIVVHRDRMCLHFLAMQVGDSGQSTQAAARRQTTPITYKISGLLRLNHWQWQMSLNFKLWQFIYCR